MPSRKQPSAPPSQPREDRIERLTDAVESLAGEVNVLRIAIDDIRAELEYAVKVLKNNLWLPTSQPADPPSETSIPFTPKVRTETVMNEAPAPAPTMDAPATQGDLF